MNKPHDKPLNYIAHSVYCVFFFYYFTSRVCWCIVYKLSLVVHERSTACSLPTAISPSACCISFLLTPSHITSVPQCERAWFKRNVVKESVTSKMVAISLHASANTLVSNKEHLLSFQRQLLHLLVSLPQ